MGEGDFRPSTARRPLDRFSWNLKYITTSRTRPRTQNFRGLRRRGWSGQIASLTHESFCPFFVSSPRPQVAFWTHPNAQYVIMRRFHQGSAFWELESTHPMHASYFPIFLSFWKTLSSHSQRKNCLIERIYFTKDRKKMLKTNSILIENFLMQSKLRTHCMLN